MANGELKLEDNDFWGDFDRNRAAVVGRVAKEKFLGLLVDAPVAVSTAQRQTAPVVGYFARTLRDDAAINEEEQMLVAAVNLGTNAVAVGRALTPEKPSVPKRPPDGDPGEGATVTAFSTDLRRALGLPWQPARYAVAVLCREFLSNPVAVEFGRGPGDYKDPEVIKFLSEQRAKGPLPPPEKVHPPKSPAGAEPLPPLPDYAKRDDSPPVPEKPGIEFAVDRVVLAKPDAKCLLKGSFRLPVLPREKVTPRGDAKEPPDVGDPKATAVVPIHVVVTGSESAGPWVLGLWVPTYDPVPPGPDPAEATGHFALDLFQLKEFPRVPMTYFLTAFNGEVVSGPKAVGVVTEDMIGK